jgi:hypothetical protein
MEEPVYLVKERLKGRSVVDVPEPERFTNLGVSSEKRPQFPVVSEERTVSPRDRLEPDDKPTLVAGSELSAKMADVRNTFVLVHICRVARWQ